MDCATGEWYPCGAWQQGISLAEWALASEWPARACAERGTILPRTRRENAKSKSDLNFSVSVFFYVLLILKLVLFDKMAKYFHGVE